VDLDLDQVKARPPDRAAAYELFKELEFAALTREFADAATVAPAGTMDNLNYVIIDSRAALDGLIKSLWDAESVGIAIADSTSSKRLSDKTDNRTRTKSVTNCRSNSSVYRFRARRRNSLLNRRGQFGVRRLQ